MDAMQRSIKGANWTGYGEWMKCSSGMVYTRGLMITVLVPSSAPSTIFSELNILLAINVVHSNMKESNLSTFFSAISTIGLRRIWCIHQIRLPCGALHFYHVYIFTRRSEFLLFRRSPVNLLSRSAGSPFHSSPFSAVPPVRHFAVHLFGRSAVPLFRRSQIL